MPELTLVSHDLCPFVQRAAIALSEKGVPFERVYVDLSAKPDWFMEISPLGKVPLLRVRDEGREAIIFESAVILEFLEETHQPALHPADPLERARHRSWMEFGSAILNAIARLYNAGGQQAFDKERDGLKGLFERLERELAGRGGGPYFAGTGFSLVDAVYGPIFRYLDTFEAKAGLNLVDGRPRIADWRAALAQRPSVRDAVRTGYPERLTEFLRKRDSTLSGMIAA